MASKEFGNHIIGETYVTELEKSIGKIMSINMMALTNDPKRQNTNVYFEITDKKGTELHTRLIGFEISAPYIKRIYKRVKSKVEDSYPITLKDDLKIRIKPSISCKGESHASVLTTMQKKAYETIKRELESKNFSEALSFILNNDLTRIIKNDLKKIFPISSIIIKSAKLEK